MLGGPLVASLGYALVNFLFFSLSISGSLMPVLFQCELTLVYGGYVPPNIAGCGFRLSPGTVENLGC